MVPYQLDIRHQWREIAAVQRVIATCCTCDEHSIFHAEVQFLSLAGSAAITRFVLHTYMVMRYILDTNARSVQYVQYIGLYGHTRLVCAIYALISSQHAHLLTWRDCVAWRHIQRWILEEEVSWP